MAVTEMKGTALPSQRVVIERGPVANFATAVTDTNPVFHDARAASEAGFDAIPVPPTFPFAMHAWGAFPEIQPAREDEGPDPVSAAIGELMSGGGLLLHGEQEFVYHRTPQVGDVLTSTGSIKDVYVKEGSSGTMTFVVTETEWRDEDDAPVVTTTMTLLHRV